MNRPGGLTALAVFNFVIGGLYGLIGIIALIAFMRPAASAPPQPVPSWVVGFRLGYLLVDVVLLILAGIGYLRLRRVLGRWLGTGEAMLGLLYFVFNIIVSVSMGFRFSFVLLTNLVYPGITLVLLNVVFRENLTN